MDKYMTVTAEFLTGIYHYVFCAEFLNTQVELQTVVEGLAIASSNFVLTKSEVEPRMKLSKEHEEILLQADSGSSISEMLEVHY